MSTKSKMTYDDCKNIASKYSSRKEFLKNAPFAYRVAGHMHWLDDLFPLTHDICKQSAHKFKTKTEFFNGDKIAYYASLRNGWLDEFFPNSLRKPITLDELKHLVKKYPTCNKLREADFSAYSKALDKGWIDILYPNRQKFRILTFNICKDIASKFKTTTEFRKGDYVAYRKSCAMGWINQFGIKPTNGSKKYDEDDIIKTAMKYTSLRDFRLHNKALCDAARNRGLLEKMPWLVKSGHGREGTPVSCIYVYEFNSTKTAYVGLTITKQLRHNDHKQPGDSVYDYAKSIGATVPDPKYIYDNITIKESKRLEQEVMDLYLKNGWNLLNKAKGGSLGNLNTKLTKDMCIKIAKEYTFIVDLMKEHRTVWDKMRANGWNKQCPWLKRKSVETGTWLNIKESEAYNIAKQFVNRHQFDRAYRRLYLICLKNGWIDKWFPLTKHTNKPKAVEAYTLDGSTLVGRYASIHAAARAYGCSHDHINNVCKGVYNTACGLIWKYADK